MTAGQGRRVLFDVNIIVSIAIARRAGRLDSIPQKALALARAANAAGPHYQVVVSHAMIETARTVLLAMGAPRDLVETMLADWAALSRAGPDRLDPFLILGGSRDPRLGDREDGAVLATAFAARAELIVTDDLKHFAVGARSTKPGGILRRPGREDRRLVVHVHERPDGRRLGICHPADFLRWSARGVDPMARALEE